MSIYNKQEVLKDIKIFEGADIHLTDEVITGFIKLYSEFFDTPLKGSATVTDLEERIQLYIKSCMIPYAGLPLDVKPSDEFEFTTYYHNGKEYIRYGEYRTIGDIEDALAILKDKDLLSNNVIMYLRGTNEFIAFNRKMNA